MREWKSYEGMEKIDELIDDDGDGDNDDDCSDDDDDDDDGW